MYQAAVRGRPGGLADPGMWNIPGNQGGVNPAVAYSLARTMGRGRAPSTLVKPKITAKFVKPAAAPTADQAAPKYLEQPVAPKPEPPPPAEVERKTPVPYSVPKAESRRSSAPTPPSGLSQETVASSRSAPKFRGRMVRKKSESSLTSREEPMTQKKVELRKFAPTETELKKKRKRDDEMAERAGHKYAMQLEPTAIAIITASSSSQYEDINVPTEEIKSKQKKTLTRKAPSVVVTSGLSNPDLMFEDQELEFKPRGKRQVLKEPSSQTYEENISETVEELPIESKHKPKRSGLKPTSKNITEHLELTERLSKVKKRDINKEAEEYDLESLPFKKRQGKKITRQELSEEPSIDESYTVDMEPKAKAKHTKTGPIKHQLYADEESVDDTGVEKRKHKNKEPIQLRHELEAAEVSMGRSKTKKGQKIKFITTEQEQFAISDETAYDYVEAEAMEKTKRGSKRKLQQEDLHREDARGTDVLTKLKLKQKKTVPSQKPHGQLQAEGRKKKAHIEEPNTHKLEIGPMEVKGSYSNSPTMSTSSAAEEHERKDKEHLVTNEQGRHKKRDNGKKSTKMAKGLHEEDFKRLFSAAIARPALEQPEILESKPKRQQKEPGQQIKYRIGEKAIKLDASVEKNGDTTSSKVVKDKHKKEKNMEIEVGIVRTPAVDVIEKEKGKRSHKQHKIKERHASMVDSRITEAQQDLHKGSHESDGKKRKRLRSKSPSMKMRLSPEKYVDSIKIVLLPAKIIGVDVRATESSSSMTDDDASSTTSSNILKDYQLLHPPAEPSAPPASFNELTPPVDGHHFAGSPTTAPTMPYQAAWTTEAMERAGYFMPPFYTPMRAADISDSSQGITANQGQGLLMASAQQGFVMANQYADNSFYVDLLQSLSNISPARQFVGTETAPTLDRMMEGEGESRSFVSGDAHVEYGIPTRVGEEKPLSSEEEKGQSFFSTPTDRRSFSTITIQDIAPYMLISSEKMVTDESIREIDDLKQTISQVLEQQLNVTSPASNLSLLLSAISRGKVLEKPCIGALSTDSDFSSQDYHLSSSQGETLGKEMKMAFTSVGDEILPSLQQDGPVEPGEQSQDELSLVTNAQSEVLPEMYIQMGQPPVHVMKQIGGSWHSAGSNVSASPTATSLPVKVKKPENLTLKTTTSLVEPDVCVGNEMKGNIDILLQKVVTDEPQIEYSGTKETLEIQDEDSRGLAQKSVTWQVTVLPMEKESLNISADDATVSLQASFQNFMSEVVEMLATEQIASQSKLQDDAKKSRDVGFGLDDQDHVWRLVPRSSKTHFAAMKKSRDVGFGLDDQDHVWRLVPRSSKTHFAANIVEIHESVPELTRKFSGSTISTAVITHQFIDDEWTSAEQTEMPTEYEGLSDAVTEHAEGLKEPIISTEVEDKSILTPNEVVQPMEKSKLANKHSSAETFKTGSKLKVEDKLTEFEWEVKDVIPEDVNFGASPTATAFEQMQIGSSELSRENQMERSKFDPSIVSGTQSSAATFRIDSKGLLDDHKQFIKDDLEAINSTPSTDRLAASQVEGILVDTEHEYLASDVELQKISSRSVSLRTKPSAIQQLFERTVVDEVRTSDSSSVASVFSMHKSILSEGGQVEPDKEMSSAKSISNKLSEGNKSLASKHSEISRITSLQVGDVYKDSVVSFVKAEPERFEGIKEESQVQSSVGGFSHRSSVLSQYDTEVMSSMSEESQKSMLNQQQFHKSSSSFTDATLRRELELIKESIIKSTESMKLSGTESESEEMKQREYLKLLLSDKEAPDREMKTDLQDTETIKPSSSYVIVLEKLSEMSGAATSNDDKTKLPTSDDYTSDGVAGSTTSAGDENLVLPTYGKSMISERFIEYEDFSEQPALANRLEGLDQIRSINYLERDFSPEGEIINPDDSVEWDFKTYDELDTPGKLTQGLSFFGEPSDTNTRLASVDGELSYFIIPVITPGYSPEDGLSYLKEVKVMPYYEAEDEVMLLDTVTPSHISEALVTIKEEKSTDSEILALKSSGDQYDVVMKRYSSSEHNAEVEKSKLSSEFDHKLSTDKPSRLLETKSHLESTPSMKSNTSRKSISTKSTRSLKTPESLTSVKQLQQLDILLPAVSGDIDITSAVVNTRSSEHGVGFITSASVDTLASKLSFDTDIQSAKLSVSDQSKVGLPLWQKEEESKAQIAKESSSISSSESYSQKKSVASARGTVKTIKADGIELTITPHPSVMKSDLSDANLLSSEPKETRNESASLSDFSSVSTIKSYPTVEINKVTEHKTITSHVEPNIISFTSNDEIKTDESDYNPVNMVEEPENLKESGLNANEQLGSFASFTVKHDIDYSTDHSVPTASMEDITSMGGTKSKQANEHTSLKQGSVISSASEKSGLKVDGRLHYADQSDILQNYRITYSASTKSTPKVTSRFHSLGSVTTSEDGTLQKVSKEPSTSSSLSEKSRLKGTKDGDPWAAAAEIIANCKLQKSYISAKSAVQTQKLLATENSASKLSEDNTLPKQVSDTISLTSSAGTKSEAKESEHMDNIRVSTVSDKISQKEKRASVTSVGVKSLSMDSASSSSKLPEHEQNISSLSVKSGPNVTATAEDKLQEKLSEQLNSPLIFTPATHYLQKEKRESSLTSVGALTEKNVLSQHVLPGPNTTLEEKPWWETVEPSFESVSMNTKSRKALNALQKQELDVQSIGSLSAKSIVANHVALDSSWTSTASGGEKEAKETSLTDTVKSTPKDSESSILKLTDDVLKEKKEPSVGSVSSKSATKGEEHREMSLTSGPKDLTGPWGSWGSIVIDIGKSQKELSSPKDSAHPDRPWASTATINEKFLNNNSFTSVSAKSTPKGSAISVLKSQGDILKEMSKQSDRSLGARSGVKEYAHLGNSWTSISAIDKLERDHKEASLTSVSFKSTPKVSASSITKKPDPQKVSEEQSTASFSSKSQSKDRMHPDSSWTSTATINEKWLKEIKDKSFASASVKSTPKGSESSVRKYQDAMKALNEQSILSFSSKSDVHDHINMDTSKDTTDTVNKMEESSSTSGGVKSLPKLNATYTSKSPDDVSKAQNYLSTGSLNALSGAKDFAPVGNMFDPIAAVEKMLQKETKADLTSVHTKSTPKESAVSVKSPDEVLKYMHELSTGSLNVQFEDKGLAKTDSSFTSTATVDAKSQKEMKDSSFTTVGTKSKQKESASSIKSPKEFLKALNELSIGSLSIKSGAKEFINQDSSRAPSGISDTQLQQRKNELSLESLESDAMLDELQKDHGSVTRIVSKFVDIPKSEYDSQKRYNEISNTSITGTRTLHHWSAAEPIVDDRSQKARIASSSEKSVKSVGEHSHQEDLEHIYETIDDVLLKDSAELSLASTSISSKTIISETSLNKMLEGGEVLKSGTKIGRHWSAAEPMTDGGLLLDQSVRTSISTKSRQKLAVDLDQVGSVEMNDKMVKSSKEPTIVSPTVTKSGPKAVELYSKFSTAESVADNYSQRILLSTSSFNEKSDSKVSERISSTTSAGEKTSARSLQEMKESVISSINRRASSKTATKSISNLPNDDRITEVVTDRNITSSLDKSSDHYTKSGKNEMEHTSLSVSDYTLTKDLRLPKEYFSPGEKSDQSLASSPSRKIVGSEQLDSTSGEVITSEKSKVFKDSNKTSYSSVTLSTSPKSSKKSIVPTTEDVMMSKVTVKHPSITSTHSERPDVEKYTTSHVSITSTSSDKSLPKADARSYSKIFVSEKSDESQVITKNEMSGISLLSGRSDGWHSSFVDSEIAAQKRSNASISPSSEEYSMSQMPENKSPTSIRNMLDNSKQRKVASIEPKSATVDSSLPSIPDGAVNVASLMSVPANDDSKVIIKETDSESSGRKSSSTRSAHPSQTEGDHVKEHDVNIKSSTSSTFWFAPQSDVKHNSSMSLDKNAKSTTKTSTVKSSTSDASSKSHDTDSSQQINIEKGEVPSYMEQMVFGVKKEETSASNKWNAPVPANEVDEESKELNINYEVDPPLSKSKKTESVGGVTSTVRNISPSSLLSQGAVAGHVHSSSTKSLIPSIGSSASSRSNISELSGKNEEIFGTVLSGTSKKSFVSQKSSPSVRSSVSVKSADSARLQESRPPPSTIWESKYDEEKIKSPLSRLSVKSSKSSSSEAASAMNYLNYVTVDNAAKTLDPQTKKYNSSSEIKPTKPSTKPPSASILSSHSTSSESVAGSNISLPKEPERSLVGSVDRKEPSTKSSDSLSLQLTSQKSETSPVLNPKSTESFLKFDTAATESLSSIKISTEINEPKKSPGSRNDRPLEPDQARGIAEPREQRRSSQFSSGIMPALVPQEKQHPRVETGVLDSKFDNGMKQPDVMLESLEYNRIVSLSDQDDDGKFKSPSIQVGTESYNDNSLKPLGFSQLGFEIPETVEEVDEELDDSDNKEEYVTDKTKAKPTVRKLGNAVPPLPDVPREKPSSG